MYAVIGEKAVYINIIMFFGDDQGNIKRYKVVQRGNESAAGQGKAIQCVIHLVW